MRMEFVLGVILCFFSYVLVAPEVAAKHQEYSGSGQQSTDEDAAAVTKSTISDAKRVPDTVKNSSLVNSTSINSTITTPLTTPLNITSTLHTTNTTRNATNSTGSAQNASKRFMDSVKPIGKMETLEINVNGSTSTKNSFAENEEDEDKIQSNRLDFIKVRSDRGRKETQKHAGKKTKRHEKKHATRKRRPHKKSSGMKKQSKLKKQTLLSSKESNKRSLIENVASKNEHASQLNGDTSNLNDGEEDDESNTKNEDDDSDDEEEGDEKRSNVNVEKKAIVNESSVKSLPYGRRYTVKGYKDNMAVQASVMPVMGNTISTKKDKGVAGVKKSGNPVEVKTKEEIDRKLQNYKSSVVPSDAIMQNEIAQSRIKDFVNQMTTAPFAPHESASPFFPEVKYTNSAKTTRGKTLKEQYKMAKANRSGAIMAVGVAKNKNNLKEKNVKYPSPAMKEDNDDDDRLDEEDDNDEEDSGEDNGDNIEDDRDKDDNRDEDKEIPPIISVTPPQNPGNLGAPPPVTNIPQFPNTAPINVQNKPQQSPQQTQAPYPVEQASQVDDAEMNMVRKVEENKQNIDALFEKVTELESKEIELERAMGDIGNGLERIEKKLDLQQQQKLQVEQQPYRVSEWSTFRPQQNVMPVKPQTSEPIRPLTMPDNGVGMLPRRRPHILKEIFIPLPPRDSQAAKEIEAGAPISSPVLDRLPLPIRMIVSQLFRQQLKDVKRPSPIQEGVHSSIEPDEPPREHDIDKLEMEIGRVPISRHPSFFAQRKPKILFLSKAPTFFDLLDRPCNKPCENGGRCLGNNVCRCKRGFTGTRCQVPLFIRPTIVEIIRSRPKQELNFIPEIEPESSPEKSNKISVPFVLSASNEDDDDEEKQRTTGQVDQSKLVDILRHFTMPFNNMYKRNNIPAQFRYRRNGPRR